MSAVCASGLWSFSNRNWILLQPHDHSSMKAADWAQQFQTDSVSCHTRRWRSNSSLIYTDDDDDLFLLFQFGGLSRLKLISDRLILRRPPPYQTATQLVSDMWALFKDASQVHPTRNELFRHYSFYIINYIHSDFNKVFYWGFFWSQWNLPEIQNLTGARICEGSLGTLDIKEFLGAASQLIELLLLQLCMSHLFLGSVSRSVERTQHCVRHLPAAHGFHLLTVFTVGVRQHFILNVDVALCLSVLWHSWNH